MAEIFGCCSWYVECSEAGQCVKSHDPEYQGCTYRKRLEAGIVYYGKNAGAKSPEVKPTNEPRKFEIYIACYRQLFAVYSRNKNTFSYDVSEAQFDGLSNAFDSLGIPFRTRMDPLEEIEGDFVELDAPANSRVVFTFNGEDYNVLSFNGYLMQNYFADKICKALNAKGLECCIERMGSHFREQGEILAIQKQARSQEKDKPAAPDQAKPGRYVQSTIFELVNKQVAG